MAIETQEDLDLILTVGHRAQRLGVKGIEACFYAAFKHGRPIGPNAFSLGHPDSEFKLRSCVDSLRMHLETSKKFESFGANHPQEIIWSKSIQLSST